jgi:hypothetical protein
MLWILHRLFRQAVKIIVRPGGDAPIEFFQLYALASGVEGAGELLQF